VSVFFTDLPIRNSYDMSVVIKVCGDKCTIRFTKTDNALILFGDTKKRDCDVQEDKGGPVKSSKHSPK
jgi:hypothetical protein